MAFEKLAPHIDFIEESFKKKKSPRAIADDLGEPKLYQTIRRYKIAVWDLKDLVADGKEIRAAKHDAKRNEAVQEIVDTLEVVNLGKLRAKQLLSVNLGDKFAVSDGEEHKLTLGSASIYWPVGTKMLSDCARLELELSGDDPESRKASVLEDLSDAQLRAIVAAAEAPPEKGA
jgi:hypothetical protein